MNVKGMPDLASVKQTGTAKPSKWNSKTSDNSLFQSILGQQSQGRDKNVAPAQQNTARPERGSTSQTEGSVQSKPTDTVKENSDENVQAAETDTAQAADETAESSGEVTESEADTDTVQTDTTDDVVMEEQEAVAIPIILVPGPIISMESVEVTGTMEMVAPPVIQMVEHPNVEQIAGQQTVLPEMQADSSEPVDPTLIATIGEVVDELDAELASKPNAPEIQKTDTAAQQTTEPVVTSDAAEQFAVQVVKEARDLVNKDVEQTAAPVVEKEVASSTTEETSVQPVASSDDDAQLPNDTEPETETDQQKTADHKGTATANTAQVTDGGRVEFRMSGAQPLEAQQAAAPPELPQQVMDRVISQVRTAVTPDKTEFFVQLKPDYLGGLSIGLVAEDKGVVAKIMTTSQQVHNALQADMTQMVQMLRDKGINVVQMEVIYDQTANAMSQQQSDTQQQQFGQGQGRSHGRGADQTDGTVPAYDVLSSNEVLAEQGGSVEFSA